MERITSYQFLLDAISYAKSFDNKCISNYYINPNKSRELIEANELFYTKIGNVVFVFRQNRGFVNSYYYAPSYFDLKLSLVHLHKLHSKDTLIIDIVTKEATSDLLKIYDTSGFYRYSSLVRMSRVSDDEIPLNTTNSPNLKVANTDESIEVYDQLYKYFDPLAEQLPDKSDIINLSKNENILIYKMDNKVVGFIIYQLNGLTLYLRYWFVAEEFRDRKIGSTLFNYFLSKGRGAKRHLLWVIQTNKKALLRYKHYGFKEEKMFNYVLINIKNEK